MYISGSASVAVFAVAMTIPSAGWFWNVSRILLETAGALFGVYGLTVMTLLAAGVVMRRLGHSEPPSDGRGPSDARTTVPS